MARAIRPLAVKPLKRLGSKLSLREGPKSLRAPLAFIPKAKDPCEDLEEAKTNEKSIAQEVGAIQNAMVQRLKADAKRKELATSSDDYFTVAFESGEQATAFLQAVGYKTVHDAFIDGLILADLLQIKLPAAKDKIKVLQRMHDPKLTKLITNPKWRAK